MRKIDNMTKSFIDNYKTDYIKRFFNNYALYDNCIYYKSDIAKIDKLMQIKTLDNFFDNVRKLTKKVYSDFAIGRWQCLAELRYIQLDLQQNCYFDKTTNEIKVLEG